MEDTPQTSRKRRRKNEENSDGHSPGKRKKKKGKKAKMKEKWRRLEEETKPKVDPVIEEHNFQTGNGKLPPRVDPNTEHTAGNSYHARTPLKISSIPKLILFASTHDDSVPPDWCDVINGRNIEKVVVVLISGIGTVQYVKNQECFLQCNMLFDKCVATITSGSHFCVKLPHDSLLAVDIPKRAKKRGQQASQEPDTPKGREDYILTTEELEGNDYPFPDDDNSHTENNSNGKAYQKSVKAEVESPMYAVDCEMCETEEGLELTRISVVDESLNVVYDTFVKPSRPITDYKTKFSGITKKTLENVTTTLGDVQERLNDVLSHDAILIGHSFENDLRALKRYHRRVIDTSLLYTSRSGPFFKSSLKSLANQYLKKKIQSGPDGHCSIEDAKTCMELVQLKIKNGPNFGKPPVDQEGLFEWIAGKGKIGSMLDYPGVLRKYCSGATHAVSCTSDEEVVSRAVELMASSDVLWAHLHQPEMFFKEGTSNQEGEDRPWKDVLQSVDSKILQIHEAVPKDSLMLVLFGCGDLSLVKRLQKERKSNKAELKRAVKNAKKGLCFIKIT